MFILVTFSIPPIPTGTLVFLMDVMFQVLADNLQNQLIFTYWGRAVVLVHFGLNGWIASVPLESERKLDHVHQLRGFFFVYHIAQSG